MARRSPTNARFQSVFPEHLHLEDVLLQVSEETPKDFLAPRLESPANVLEEMNMADLDDAAREDILRCHSDCIILIAGNTP